MTTTTTTRLSLLQAVNRVVAQVGLGPMTSISGPHAEKALARIDETCRQVMSRSMTFNTEPMELVRDVDNKIPVPTNVLWLYLDENKYSDKIIQRGDFLYNLTDNTDVFEEDIDVTAVLLLEWTQLDNPVREAIVTIAARRFVDVSLPDQAMHAFSKEDEQMAMQYLRGMEIEQGNYNTFHNWNVDKIILTRISR